VGSTVQEENDHLLLYHDGNLRLLSFDIKEWGLDRRLQDPSIQERWHPTFHLEMGALRAPMFSLTYGAWSQREPGLSPGLPPSLTFSTEVSFLSTLVACPDSGAHWVGNSLTAAIRSWCFFLSLSLLLVRF
jgi:hypothetical protein